MVAEATLNVTAGVSSGEDALLLVPVHYSFCETSVSAGVKMK